MQNQLSRSTKLPKCLERRNFNIINNRYYSHHDEKIATEKRIETLMAAKNFLSHQEYNIIKGCYYIKETEDKYNKKCEQEKINWNKQHKDRNSLIRNPVTNYIYDKAAQEALDLKEKQSKQRYEQKEKVEMYYKCLDNSKELKRIENSNNRKSYKTYKTEDDRGYDILNFNDIYLKHKDNIINNKIKIRHLQTDWEKLLEGLSKNETISKKGIYKDKYDKTDIDKDKHYYIYKREKDLKLLPDFNLDEKFNLNKRLQKIENNKTLIEENKKLRISNIKSSAEKYIWSCNKKDWFNAQKNYPENYENRKCITNNKYLYLSNNY